MNGRECCGAPCQFWQKLPSSVSGSDRALGRCRFDPPTFSGERYVHEKEAHSLTGLDALDVASVWPLTHGDDWCGKFEPEGGFRGPC